MTSPASQHAPPRWQHMTSNTSRSPYFTKSSEDQWLYQSSVGRPLTYRNCCYPSASAALDAYIREYEKKPQGHQQKYENELMQLLVGRSQNTNGGSGEEPSGARQLGDVRRLVQDSNSRLTDTSTALDESARVMRAVEQDPLPSPSDLAFPPTRVDSQSTVTTDQLLMSNPLGLTQGVAPEAAHKARAPPTSLFSSRSRSAPRSANRQGPKDLQSTSFNSVVSSAGNQRESFASMSSSGPSSVQPGSFGGFQGSLDALQRSSGAPDWVHDLEGSDASSIVTGHFQNGLVQKPTTGGVSKMASTPKHAAHPKSDLVPSAGPDDQHHSHRGQPPAIKAATYPTATLNPSAKPCLKAVPTSSAFRPVNSKVSFANDTKLFSREPSGLMSRSESFGSVTKVGSQSGISAFQSRPAAANLTGSQTFQEIQNPHHREFLQGLMTDIEKSSGSILSDATPSVSSGRMWQPQKLPSLPAELASRGEMASPADIPSDVPLSQTAQYGSNSSSHSKEQGCGYLARIRHLLSSPVLTDTQTMAASSSPSTDALEGDRPWEQHGAIKEPMSVEDKASPAMIKQYKQLQMMCNTPANLEQTLTGGSQPGSLEALKQMLFMMQSIADEQTTDGDSAAEVTLEEAADMMTADERRCMSPSTRRLLADTKQPGEESLDRAMQHLRRLKFLVESEQKSVTKPT